PVGPTTSSGVTGPRALVQSRITLARSARYSEIICSTEKPLSARPAPCSSAALAAAAGRAVPVRAPARGGVEVGGDHREHLAGVVAQRRHVHRAAGRGAGARERLPLHQDR